MPILKYQPLADTAADNAPGITALFERGGPGTIVLLNPRSKYTLLTQIKFQFCDQTLATAGYPTFESGSQAILETRGDKESGAVNMGFLSRCALRRVHIRGCRGWGKHQPSKAEAEAMKKEGKLGWVEDGAALVFMGGQGSDDSIVEGCRLEDCRGWTGIHVFEEGVRQKVINNYVGPCGQEAPDGPWADGISIAGRDTLVSGNTITDATDGAIVIFCAPGSLIINNKIINKTRNLMGAINLVDSGPFNGNFTNTQVTGNTISSEDTAFIHLGIGIGPASWTDYNVTHTWNYGGSVTFNNIGPGKIGYGISVSTARDFTVTGNISHPNTVFGGILTRDIIPPSAFVQQNVYSNRTKNLTLQEEFVEGEIGYLIGIKCGAPKTVQYLPGSLRIGVTSDVGTPVIELEGGNWVLNKNLGLMFTNTASQVVWTSSTAFGVKSVTDNGSLYFAQDGALIVYQNEKKKVLWDSLSQLRASLKLSAANILAPTSASQCTVTFSSVEPFITTTDAKKNITFCAKYVFGLDWSLEGGNWVAVTTGTSGFEPYFTEQTKENGFLKAWNKAFSGKKKSKLLVEDELDTEVEEEIKEPNVMEMVEEKTEEEDKEASKGALDALNFFRKPDGPKLTLDDPEVAIDPTSKVLASSPVWLYMSPTTAQIILHRGTFPTSPSASGIIWQSSTAQTSKSAKFILQSDGNAVIYAVDKNGKEFIPWASGSNGGKGDKKVASFAIDATGVKLLNASGGVVWQKP